MNRSVVVVRRIVAVALGWSSLASCARVAGVSADAGTNPDVSAPVDQASPLSFDAPYAADVPRPTVDAPVALPDLACGTKTPGNAGCSFYGVEPPLLSSSEGRCYAMFVVNPGNKPAKLNLTNAGTAYPLARVGRSPRGTGQNLRYQPFDPAIGVLPGDVVILFLSGKKPDPMLAGDGQPGIGCPDGTESALPDGSASQHSNRGTAFHLTSDRPVVAYDMNPFSMATSYVPSATLLIPEETWSSSNLVATPTRTYELDLGGDEDELNFKTYVTIVAAQDGTKVSVRPTSPVEAATGIPATNAGQTLRLTLDAGQFVQLSEGTVSRVSSTGLGGTMVSSDHPVLTIGGMPCGELPTEAAACDSTHQQIPPLSAWGHEYAAVSYRSRMTGPEPVPWLVVGAVDGTVLTYAPKAPTPYAGSPATAGFPATVPFAGFPATVPVALSAGRAIQFWTADPFVVRSQDAGHPFYLAAQMTGGDFLSDQRTLANRGAGDPDFVNVIPVDQYLNDYTFFTDPTYSETNLVLIRKPDSNGLFADVKLACASVPVSGWTDLGGIQFARVDLVSGYFKPVLPGCNNGVNRISSSAPFGLTVWGWGTTLEGSGPSEPPIDLSTTSYGYPAGAGLGTVNTASPIIIP